VRVERRVSSRGALAVAGQRVHVGMVHAGRTVTVEDADTTFRVYDGDQLIGGVPDHHQTDRPVQSPQTRTTPQVHRHH
jgi:hypothetical protein